MEKQAKQTKDIFPSKIFLLYEVGQVDGMIRFFREHPEERANYSVVALSLDIEFALSEQNIIFSSARLYKKTSADQLNAEDAMMETFFADTRWKKFEYRDIFLPTVFNFMFRSYLQRVRYYANILIPMLESYPNTMQVVLFAPSGVILKTFGTLAYREINIVIDCVKVIAGIRGASVTIMPLSMISSSLHHSTQKSVFTIKRATFGLVLKVWNLWIATVRHPRHPRLVISDHWKNVGSSIELLDEAECIFLDRKEVRHISWRNLFDYRMRFMHSENFLSRKMQKNANEVALRLNKIWSDIRDTKPPIFIWRGYSFDSLLLRAIDDIVESFDNIICEIDSTYALYKKVRPDIVLLRASVSAQTHFSILPLVAKKCNIPSVELQHGIEYLGPGSWSRDHVAEYIAIYGSLVKKEFLALGYSPKRLREIGSPRFDVNRTSDAKVGNKVTKESLSILCIAPDIRPFEIYDTYSAYDYFNNIAEAVGAIGNAHVVIKLRPGEAGESILRTIIGRVFSHVPHTIAQYETLSDLYVRSNVVISCFSTAILEALQFGLPVIIPAFDPIDAKVVSFHFSHYSDAQILSIVSDHKMFVDRLAELNNYPERLDDVRVKAHEFVANNFCFDGKSSRRYAELITELAGKNNNV